MYREVSVPGSRFVLAVVAIVRHTINNQQQHIQTHSTATLARRQGSTNNDREQDRSPSDASGVSKSGDES